jgi:alanine-glyoxylate transaminase/serine-glyoxylate transaminase/serine-pyruvate transaminase
MSYQNPVFIPGPTNIPEVIRKACDMPTVDHRSPAFARIFKPALAGVKAVLGTRAGEVILFPSTGTGGWEAAISNTLSPGDTVLAARFGMFSHRWIDMCQRHGLNVQIIETPWGEGAPLAAIEAALAADASHRIRAVLATHNETATGVKSDIAGIRKAMDRAKHPAAGASISPSPAARRASCCPRASRSSACRPGRSRRWTPPPCPGPSSTSAT